MTTSEGLDPEEAFDAISRRATMVECLLDGPKYNRDIRDELDVSRSTAYKAMTELEDLAIVRRGDHGYEATLLGRILFEQYDRFYDRIENVCRASQLLAVLPPETDIPFGFVDGARVSVSERHAPNRPVQEVEEFVAEATTISGTVPVVLPHYVDLFTEQILSDELEMELIYEEPVFDHLRTNYEQEQRQAVETGNLDMWVTTKQLPFALLHTEPSVQKAAVVVYDATGDVRGVLVNDTEEAYRWAREQWERYRDGAREASLGAEDDT